MSRLNDINSLYGKQFGVAIANTTAENVMKAEGLPKNYFIIASPAAKLKNSRLDFGAHSLIVTDAFGTPVRMTYSMSEGNGLVISNGSLKINIDNYTIKESSDGKLYVDIQNLIDSNSIVLQNGQIVINAQNLTKASANTFGVVKLDGRTIKSQNGVIYVDTQKLDVADDSSGLMGILKGGSETVKATRGVLSVKQDSLAKTSQSSYGVAKVGQGLKSTDGVISVDMNSLTKVSSQNYGIGKADNITLKELNGILSIYYDSIGKASSTSFGLIRSDNTSMVATNGVLSVKNLSQMQKAVLDIGYNILFLNQRLDTLYEQVANLTPGINRPMIFSFVCDGISAVSLKKPSEYGELPENMETQKVSATFIINTNCPFKLFIDYEDNVSPEITLYETNYNDVDVYPGNVALTRTFQSTNEEDVRLTFSWMCKNYLSNDKTEYSTKTRMKLRVAFANDIEINKEVRYSISRFNSLYDESINGEGDDVIIGGDGDGPSSHKVRYWLELNEIPALNGAVTGSFLRNIDYESYMYTIKDDTQIYHAYTENNIYVPESTYVNLFNASGSAVLNRYGRNLDTGDIIERTKKTLTATDLSSRKLIVTAYEVVENRDGFTELPTNDVSLVLNGSGNIRALYKKGFTQTEYVDYGLRLKEIPVGAFLTTNVSGTLVNDETNIYHTYTHNNNLIEGNNSYMLLDGTKRVVIERFAESNPDVSTMMTSRNVSPNGLYVVAYEVSGDESETQTENVRLTLDGQGNVKLTYTGDLKLV